LQIDALLKEGCDRSLIFTDRISGAKSSRPGLDKCLELLSPGDTLIVWRLDRLGRSMSHLINLIESLIERKIGFMHKPLVETEFFINLSFGFLICTQICKAVIIRCK
jgi:DNA invertase Pin-like site-specific DNA recombinase